TVATTATNTVVWISRQGTVTRFRLSQLLFDSISCIPQRHFILSAMDGHGEMADAIHFDTIAGTLQNQLCNGFPLHEIDQVNEGNLLLHQAQAVQGLSSLPVGTRVFGQNKIKARRMQAISKLLGRYNHIGRDRESHALELM